jgi:hypothetical protein
LFFSLDLYARNLYIALQVGEAVASRAYYLGIAKSYFDMAAMSRDEDVRARWIERANEYLILADAIGDDSMPEPPLPEPVQPQVQQQQQQQIKDE